MFRRHPRARLLALLVALAACDDAARSATPAVVERDSAGIAIVENADPADTTADVRAAHGEPRTTIGGSDGDAAYAFGRIGGASRLDDGTIVVVDQMAAEVRFFDAAGRHVRTAGRAGDGPGEYRDPLLLGRTRGDTLLVVDRNTHRLTMLAADGREIARVDLASGRSGAPDRIVGRFADGALLARGTWRSAPGDRPGVERVDSDWFRLAADGTRRDSIGRHFDFYRSMVGDGATRLYVTRPFEREAGFAADERGFWLGDPERWELRRYDADGALRRIVRLGRAPVVIEPAELERARERYPPPLLARFPRALRELPLPETYPPYGSVRVDRSGRLWVREYAAVVDDVWPLPDPPPAPPLRWLVHDADGRLLAAVVLPPRTRPLDIGPDHLLLAVRDESDVERVELHDLPPLPAGDDR